ncbi:ATP synthase F0 subcomplex B subunit [Humidesulfovibrio mexicanus]|uniref:ATP synthase subunit b n=1 Tax=Humidesulfovibrio mexicanus TaxID=147047 RepID=A0A239CJ74_9BACT|nr:ATP synthase F0 subcomplex B subunit [Humidesulfovibrio mexicanus]
MKVARHTVLTLIGVLAFTALAYASGGEAGEDHGLPWANFGWRILNFVIFIFLLYKFAGAKAAAFFGGRRTQIRKDLEDLELRKVEAEKKLKDVETGIRNLEQERAAILAEAKTQGDAIKAAILEKAHKDAEAMKAQAVTSAENEARAAFDRVRGEIADQVIEQATKIVREKLTEKDHERLVDEYLTKVVLN